MRNCLIIFCLVLNLTVNAQRVGFLTLEHPFTSNKDATQIQQNFKAIVDKYCSKKDFEYVFVHDTVSNENSYEKYVIRKCKELHLDGIIMSRMKFVVRPTNITDTGRTLTHTEHCYVEMLYMDNEGSIVCNPRKNSSDDLYFIPTSESTFKHAVLYCLRQIGLAIYWENIDRK